MKKGFTLIELLAVIVVLAIIAVIAVPTITSVVNKAKVGALKNSAYGLIEAGALYNAQYANDHNARFDISNNVQTTTEDNKLKYKGNIKRGTVIVSTKGKVTVCITDGKNSVYKNYSETEVTVDSKKECSVPVNSSIVYLDGEASIDIVDARQILDEITALKTEINNLKSIDGNVELDFSEALHNFVSGKLTYTATKDCYLYGTMANSGTVKINDYVIFNRRDGSVDPLILMVPITKIKAGDVVTSTAAQPNLFVFDKR